MYFFKLVNTYDHLFESVSILSAVSVTGSPYATPSAYNWSVTLDGLTLCLFDESSQILYTFFSVVFNVFIIVAFPDTLSLSINIFSFSYVIW